MSGFVMQRIGENVIAIEAKQSCHRGKRTEGKICEFKMRDETGFIARRAVLQWAE
jgi:hypothetical protein